MTLNEYVCPQVRVYELDEKECLLAASSSSYDLNIKNPTTGLKTTGLNNAPVYGGTYVGESPEVCAKQNVQSLWDE
jgi:hypothetical protein